MEKFFSNMKEMVDYCAVKFGNKTAYRLKNKENGKASYRDVSYNDLKEETTALGKYFVSLGKEEKRIVIIGKNSYEWLLVYLSVLASGNVIIPIDNSLPEKELESQLNRSEADLVFYSNQHEAFFKSRPEKGFCTENSEFSELLTEGRKLNNDEEYNNVIIDSDKMSLLLFTSGTSAESKAVMLSQRNITENVHSLLHWVKLYDTDVNIALLPLHHAFGMVQMVLFMSAGMCNVFCEGLRVAKCLSEYRVSVLVGVPRIIEEMYKTIMRKLESQNMVKKLNILISVSNALRKLHIDLRKVLFKKVIDGLGGGLRLIIVGAAAANPDILKWFNDIGILSIQGYGLTETSPVVSAENDTYMRRGSIGLPLPEIEVKIINPDENGIGELITRGKNVMLGYYKNEEETKNTIKDGWLYTGDMAYIDNDGYIFITGRKKNVIVLPNGKNVFPEEIEALINDCEAVKECIVYGSNSNGNEILKAKIVYDVNFEGDAKAVIDNHIKAMNSGLHSFKRIGAYELTDKEMEKTTTLKIKRRTVVTST